MAAVSVLQSVLHFPILSTQTQPLPRFHFHVGVTAPAPAPAPRSLPLLPIRSTPHDHDHDHDRPPALDLKSNGRAAQSQPSLEFLDLESSEEAEKKTGSSSELERRVRGRGSGRQMVSRSSLLAKQVISIRSARSLGFVSQLWVDTAMWVVALVETRPNLLAAQIDKFLLDDVSQVGDVVLVQDETVLENELNLLGLDTLVGYNVTTTGRRTVGKVRGYTFNINSGAVDSLELDSFGFSLIPSSLVSTYSLLVDDILEVVSDTVVVDEDVVSRLQRMTKGIWDSQNIRQRDQMDAYSGFERRPWSVERNHREKPSGRRSRRRMARDVEDDDWEFPMDY